MATEIRPELSQKNEYWIPKHRYYELLHFCRQYEGWKKAIVGIDGYAKYYQEEHVKRSDIPKPTEKAAMTREYYTKRIDMINNVANQTDPELAEYLIYGATHGIPYDKIEASMGTLPCGREKYYKKYHEFFWNLHLARE